MSEFRTFFFVFALTSEVEFGLLFCIVSLICIVNIASSKLRSWAGYKSTAVVDRPSLFSSTASNAGGGAGVSVVVQRQQTPATATTTTTTTTRAFQLHRSVKPHLRW